MQIDFMLFLTKVLERHTYPWQTEAVSTATLWQMLANCGVAVQHMILYMLKSKIQEQFA